MPLAAGYLIMFARKMGLGAHYNIDFLEPQQANYLSDAGLVAAILARDPWMVGFTCYLWNIDRTLWVAAALKASRPELLIALGGPEITSDNAWVLESPAVDFAVVGEGVQTFSDLLTGCLSGADDGKPVAGLWRRTAPAKPAFRQPLPNLNEISSPYLHGILDAADEKLLLLETIRGCVFKCKFCYYPKSYDNLYFVSEEKIVANLRHARECGATEVVLLDPTLNQRRDFDDFLRLLARENPDHQFRYFGELRAEGIKPETARLDDCPHSTLQIVLEPTDHPAAVAPWLPQALLAACFENPNYLDRYYSLNPAGLLGSKRVLILLDARLREQIDVDWRDALGETATVVWRGGIFADEELEPFELCASGI